MSQPTVDARTVPVPAGTCTLAARAFEMALRLSASMDAVEAARTGKDAPEASPLTRELQALTRTFTTLAGMGAPAERPDLHVFGGAQLTPEFVRQTLLERGWQQAGILAGSSRLQMLARRLVHESGADQTLRGLKLLDTAPAGTMVRALGPDEWTVVAIPTPA